MEGMADLLNNFKGETLHTTKSSMKNNQGHGMVIAME